MPQSRGRTPSDFESTHPLLEWVNGGKDMQQQPATDRVKEVKPRIMATDMTLRDYFAILASHTRQDKETYADEAKERYKFADAMLAARANGP
jgi:hypothetical protein